MVVADIIIVIAGCKFLQSTTVIALWALRPQALRTCQPCPDTASEAVSLGRKAEQDPKIARSARTSFPTAEARLADRVHCQPNLETGCGGDAGLAQDRSGQQPAEPRCHAAAPPIRSRHRARRSPAAHRRQILRLPQHAAPFVEPGILVPVEIIDQRIFFAGRFWRGRAALPVRWPLPIGPAPHRWRQTRCRVGWYLSSPSFPSPSSVRIFAELTVGRCGVLGSSNRTVVGNPGTSQNCANREPTAPNRLAAH
ncbi:hypothetical protein SAMN02927900_05926 [Rhizobium mongolense subsp. loessense]|uniref:Uncharacterized protein n=1 Tax=Rhizobium mongolense subsp. loessense TaxID=158890 RepID=A0A1G4U177_9HYPH|nr:hypothetical protein SAMN02927900_05926 [Rhizobium mongolense subsp. loessense]